METSNCKGQGTGGTGYQAVIDVPDIWRDLVERDSRPHCSELRREGWLTVMEYSKLINTTHKRARSILNSHVDAGDMETMDAFGRSGLCSVYRPTQQSSGSRASKRPAR